MLPVWADNPYGLAMTDSLDARAQRVGIGPADYDWSTQRGWKVVNPPRRMRSGRRSPTSSCPAHASRP